jgi:glycosyltransferase involved in cell wall biosynthesis
MPKLKIYGTVFNNAEYIDACLNSLKPLGKLDLYVVDNYSTDRTVEKLLIWNNYFNMHIYEKKCTRGAGRQLALEYLKSESSPEDLAFYIDFDTVYSNKFVETILSASKTIKDNELSIAMLGTVRTQKLAEWKDLNVGEDWERMAHFVSKGVKILEIITPDGSYGTNRNQDEERQYKRELFYSKSKIRLFKNLIDEHRGIAYKTWRGSAKHLTSIIANYVAHLIALILGTYSYDKELDNRELVLSKIGV